MPAEEPDKALETSVAGETAAVNPPVAAEVPRRIPNVGHTILFFAIAILVMVVASVAALSLVTYLHLMGHEAAEELFREPRLLIPSMAIGYFIAGTIVWAVFRRVWRRSFRQVLHWNFAVVRRRWGALVTCGVVLSLAVQFLSNFLPIPKTLPIDDFFRTPGDVWLVALFGTLVAPVFEELAFRGFLLPSLASSWDWLRTPKELWSNGTAVEAAPVDPAKDPRWSIFALIFSCALTSMGFALVHADQLAHAWAPLAVLFAVSLVLCTVRLWTHSLAASTFIHATYNATIFAVLFVATGGFRHLDKIQ